MKVTLCDRCATIIYDVKDVHRILVQVSDDKYIKRLEVCPDCTKKTIENFENFINICD